MLDAITIPSPKRLSKRKGFQKVYPYYAGYPDTFVAGILESFARPHSVVYDPWNGSGTTTAVAARLGFPSIGHDLNPVMVIVSRSRLVPPTDANPIMPLASILSRLARENPMKVEEDDPLLAWFERDSAAAIRSLENTIRACLASDSPSISDVSSIACLFYTSLFSATRSLASSLRTANPTWVRRPRSDEEKPVFATDDLHARFLASCKIMQIELLSYADVINWTNSTVALADTTQSAPSEDVDCIITSPPYCTRIDYAASTQIELAIIDRLVPSRRDLRSLMLGTTMVNNKNASIEPLWGRTCCTLLNKILEHESKASRTYYYWTHIDYFSKLFKSIVTFSGCLRPGGTVVMVAQDSFYKDVYNDLPQVIVEMAAQTGVKCERRVDFEWPNCISRVNSRAVAHQIRRGSRESVLIMKKVSFAQRSANRKHVS